MSLHFEDHLRLQFKAKNAWIRIIRVYQSEIFNQDVLHYSYFHFRFPFLQHIAALAFMWYKYCVVVNAMELVVILILEMTEFFSKSIHWYYFIVHRNSGWLKNVVKPDSEEVWKSSTLCTQAINLESVSEAPWDFTYNWSISCSHSPHWYNGPTWAPSPTKWKQITYKLYTMDLKTAK